VDEQRQYWRTFAFVEGIRTFEAVESPAQAYQAGLAFGSFQDLLSDLPARELAPTIPDFHHTRKRFDRLQQAIRDAAPARRSDATAEITFATAQEPVVDVLLDAQARGLLHERVTHNDTKFNNVMLDVETGHGMCVVDLDTVMPGLVLYDFGDMVRTTTSPTREDETDLSKVALDLATFRELARGYLEATRSFLTPAERSFLVFAGKLITYTIGIRFLTDFLEGDHYFRIQRPRHNLERARNQFKLMESIRRQEAPMQRVIDDLG
jgi:Ser/Thr protein kinase RdoA (MazF antagonist)